MGQIPFLSTTQRIPWIPILALLFVPVVCFHEIDNFDTWLNVRAGGYILDEGVIPKADVFSHTQAGTPWVYHEWLSAVLLELVRRISGTPGLVLLTGAIAFLSFALMLRLASLQGSSTLACFFVLVGVLAGSGRFSVRCHLFTLLFFSLFLFVLEKNRLKRTRALFALPFLQIVWTNSHGGFALGIALLGAYFLGGLLAATKPFRKNAAQTGELSAGYARSLLLVLLASAAATLVNPYGLDLALKPFLEFGSDSLGGNINEWAPPLEYTPFPPRLVTFYKIGLLLAGAALLSHFIAPRPAQAIVLLAMIGLSLSARRHLALFGLALVPYCTAAYAAAFSTVRDRWQMRRRAGNDRPQDPSHAPSPSPSWSLFDTGRIVVRFLLLVCLISITLQFTTNRAYQRDHLPTAWGTRPCPLIQPVRAIDFLEEYGVIGNIFNNYSVGGYIAYRLFPEHKVFLDGRNVMYGDFLKEYDDVLQDPGKQFHETAERYSIGTVVLRHTSPGVLGLVSYLDRCEEFSLAYYDEVAAIYLKGAHETVRGDALREESQDDRYPTGHLALGQFYLAQGRGDKAKEEFEKATERAYPVPEAHLALANLYLRYKRIDDAEQAARSALEIHPEWLAAHGLLADILLAKDPPYAAEAEKHMLACLEIQPDHISTRVKYAVLLASTKEPERGEEMLRKVVEEVPGDPSLNFTLAQLLEGRGKRAEAKSYYEKAVEVSPEHSPSHYALGAMYFQESNWEAAKIHAKRATELREDPKSKRLLKEINKKLRQAVEEMSPIEGSEKTLPD